MKEIYEIDWDTGTARRVDDEIQAEKDRLKARIEDLEEKMHRGWWEEPWFDDPEAIMVQEFGQEHPYPLHFRRVRCTVQRVVIDT